MPFLPSKKVCLKGNPKNTVGSVQSCHTRRSLFLGRLWVKIDSDQCSRTVWDPRMLQDASLFPLTYFCFDFQKLAVLKARQSLFSRGFVPKRPIWISHQSNFAFLLYCRTGLCDHIIETKNKQTKVGCAQGMLSNGFVPKQPKWMQKKCKLSLMRNRYGPFWYKSS